MTLPSAPRAALRGLALSFLLAPSALADVLVVDAFGGGDFTTLQAAADAALEGDTLLVRAGTYAGFGVTGKGLVVVAERDAAPQVTDTVRVENLPGDSTFVLSGLTVTSTYTTDLTKVHALVVNNCDGAVRVQDCVLTGANNANDNQVNFGDGSGGRGALLVQDADVVLSRCTLFGGRGHQQYNCCDFGGTGGEGLFSLTTVLTLYDCDVTGGEGGYSGWGGPGGAAVHVPDFGVFAAGCTLTGGEGGFGDDFIFGPGGDGGAGLRIGATAQAQLRDNDLVGGAGGGSFLGDDGSPGVALDDTSGGTVVQFAGSARRFTLPSVGWEGSLVPVVVQGEPGDQVWLPGSVDAGFRFAAPLAGVWTLALPVKMLAVPQGVVPASGTLELLVPITALAGEADVRHLQGYVISSGGQGFTGTPTAFVRLGCTFSPDCDASGVPDACEIQSGDVTDCNQNGIPDSCDVADGTLADCNLNGVADVCDIDTSASVDCDLNGVPDECQYDCNGNGIADVCDVQSGFSADCDGNLVPDECDVDCNANGVPDTCDITSGTSLDVNRNGVPDECQSPTDVYLVDDDGPPYGADGTPAKPFDTLGKAFAYAIDGNTILVEDGTYDGPENRGLSFDGRDLTVASVNGAAGVVIDCEGLDRAFTLDPGTTLAARLEGLTIRNGDAVDAQPNPGSGGGVLITLSGAGTLVDCVIEQCNAWSGGGVYVNPQSDAWLEGCALLQNTATSGTSFSGGGGLSSHGSPSTGTLVMLDCTVRHNEAGMGSGMTLGSGTNIVESCDVSLNEYAGFGTTSAVWHSGTGALQVSRSTITQNVGAGNASGVHSVATGSLLVSHCVLAGNTSNSLGGAVSVRNFGTQTLTAVVEDCLIVDNHGGSGAGINAIDVPSLAVRNCTFAFNSANQGGAAYIDDVPAATFRNCVLWDNVANSSGASFYSSGTAVVDVDFCDSEGGVGATATAFGGAFVWGANNLDLDPLFVDPDGPDDSFATWADNDFRLGPLSPCADAGDNAAVGADVLDLDDDLDVLEPVPFDLDLLPRFEDDPAVPDTGAGTAPIVDLGAYERP